MFSFDSPENIRISNLSYPFIHTRTWGKSKGNIRNKVGLEKEEGMQSCLLFCILSHAKSEKWFRKVDCLMLTLSYMMLKNGETRFKNLAV